MAQLETEDFIVQYKDDPETVQKVFDHLIKNYFSEYETFSGEAIMQSDAPQIHAPELLSDIADDIIQFEVKVKEE